MQAAADTKIARDALGPELYSEYLICKDLPLQIRFEDIEIAIASARNMKRIKLAAALSEELATLSYSPSGASAAEMRTRLETLVSQLDSRYDVHVDLEDCESCGVCVDYQLLIIAILGSECLFLTRLRNPEILHKKKISSVESNNRVGVRDLE